MTDLALLQRAIEARKMSYSPYSNFRVGAALLAKKSCKKTEPSEEGSVVCEITRAWSW